MIDITVIGAGAALAHTAGARTDFYASDYKGRPPHPPARNDNFRLQPNRSDSTFGARNFGVGIDVENGTIPELIRWD